MDTRGAAADVLSWIDASDHRGDHSEPPHSRDHVHRLLTAIEAEITRSPSACFTVTSEGAVTLRVAGRTYHAGRFEVLTIADLRARIRPRPEAPGRIRLSIVRGTGPSSDIGRLQAIAPEGVLFQAASQFNCLEAPSAHVVAINQYTFDPTQGPRASVSAFPGTFVRHYFAPRSDGTRFIQTDLDCVNLLADVLDPRIARVRSGYLQPHDIHDAAALASALEQRFDQIRVGLHDDVEVVLGGDWGGSVPTAPHHRIAQVFTSTIALGGYGRDDGSRQLVTIRQQLLRAAYLGTLLGAVALGKHTLVLTMIGGGVFANPHDAIWDAIHWASDQVAPLVHDTFDLVVNVRDGHVRATDVTRSEHSEGHQLHV
jgi:hypothetical protein